MASVDNFEIAVRGRGGHGGQPQHAKDPVQAACQLVVAMQSLVSRGVDPLEGAVVTVGQIQGGHAYNVIPEVCHLKGTLRAHSEPLRHELRARLEALCRGLIGGLGLESDLSWLDGCPATVNHPAMAALARRAADRAMGPGCWVDPRPTMAAEDFSFFLEKAPGAYLWLGLGDARGPLHNPRFDFNDQAMESGIRLFLEILQEIRLTPVGGRAQGISGVTPSGYQVADAGPQALPAIPFQRLGPFREPPVRGGAGFPGGFRRGFRRPPSGPPGRPCPWPRPRP